MNTDKKGRGGWRGGGRPKKRPSELQRIRSIRATDKDWAEIKKILPVIKNRRHDAAKKVCVFLLSQEEEASIHSFLIQDLIDRRREVLSESTSKLLGQTHERQEDVHSESTGEGYRGEAAHRSFAARQKAIGRLSGEGDEIDIPAAPAVGEDEAVEAFRMFYRLNPVQAAMMAQAGLDKERRIAIGKARREEEREIMDSLEERIQKALSAADNANRALEAAFSAKKL